MPYSYMNMSDLAQFMGMDIRKAHKLAQQGEIPCQKVGGQLRFHRAEVATWMQQQVGTMHKSRLSEFDRGISASRNVHSREEIVTPLLRKEAVCLNLPARTRKSVLKELVILAGKTDLLYDEDALLDSLAERENICSTAMEGGIAIPHPHRPQPYIIGDAILVIARTGQGIGFGAPDGKLSDMFFMTCSEDSRHHLHILARLCRMLQGKDFAHQLRQSQTPEEIISVTRQRELQVIKETHK